MGLEIFGVNNPDVSEMFTLMIASFKDALAQRPTPWARGISGFTSTAELRQKFPIDLTALAGYEEWGSEMSIKDGDLEAFFVDSKPWVRAIKVPLDVAKSPGFGPYVNKVPNLVRASVAQQNILVSKLLLNGKTSTGWDKVNFFSTLHPVDFRSLNTKNVYSNLKTASPFNRGNFATAKKLFRQMKAPDGVTSLGLELTHVLAGTDMEETFDQLFKKTLIATDNAGAAATSGTTTAASAATETNIYYGGAQPIIAPELDANAEPGVWYGLAMNTDSKPFEMQFENGAEPQIIILGDGTEHAAKNNEVLFRGKMFGNAGYAIPHCVIRFEPT